MFKPHQYEPHERPKQDKDKGSLPRSLHLNIKIGIFQVKFYSKGRHMYEQNKAC